MKKAKIIVMIIALLIFLFAITFEDPSFDDAVIAMFFVYFATSEMSLRKDLDEMRNDIKNLQSKSENK